MAQGEKAVAAPAGTLERLPRAEPLVLDPMAHMMDDLFGRQVLRPAGSRRPFAGLPPLAPVVDVIERDEEIIVRAAVPGVKKDDIDLSVSGTLLTIHCRMREAADEEGEYYRAELPRGSYSRVLALPAEVEEAKAKATLREGILELVLPKPHKSRRHRIKIA